MAIARSFLVFTVPLVLTQSLGAQDLTTGQWTGLLKLTGGPAANVVLDVSTLDGALHITMSTVGGPVTEVTDFEIDGHDAVFLWGAFACSVMLRDDSLIEGQCATADGTDALLTLNAPADRGLGEDVLTHQDLVETNALDVYEALERIRPYWIRRSGSGRLWYEAVVSVYIDSQLMGDVTLLRQIPIEDVEEVTYLSASDATTRFGTNNDGGAILITRRRG